MNELIAAAIDVFKADPLSSGRPREAVWARMAIYVRLREQNYSLSWIGRQFGKDHATVLHSLKMHKNLIEFDKIYRDHYYLFESMLPKIMNTKIVRINGKVYVVGKKKQEILTEFCEMSDEELELVFDKLKTA